MYGGTVSRCVDRVTPPLPCEAQTFARPLATSCDVTFQPRLISQREMKSTAGPSAPVEDWRARSSAASATTSVIGLIVAGDEGEFHLRPRIFHSPCRLAQYDEGREPLDVPEAPKSAEEVLVAGGEMFSPIVSPSRTCSMNI